ncbi:MAG: hypothetical protein IH593_08000 [Bacteroidales bacterium]|nr:hypothetical protein [Bacteroidales bacterium]
MKNSENHFQNKQLKVPVDSSWTFIDSITISEKGDTTWFRTAEKLFINTEEINKAYLCDSGVNREVARSAFFKRKFKWFTTTCYFSETCARSMNHAFPPEDFLSEEELQYMKLPSKVKSHLLMGADSSRYRSLRDTLDEKTGVWYMRSVISEFIEVAGPMCESSGKDSLTTEILRSRENDFFEQMGDDIEFEEICSTVLGTGIYETFMAELDSAKTIVEENLDLSLSFEEYTMQVIMPSKIISTNGYNGTEGVIAWAVAGEMFLNADYVMYVESRSVNYWAIILTVLVAVILPFDIAGHIKRKKKNKK